MTTPHIRALNLAYDHEKQKLYFSYKKIKINNEKSTSNGKKKKKWVFNKKCICVLYGLTAKLNKQTMKLISSNLFYIINVTSYL